MRGDVVVIEVGIGALLGTLIMNIVWKVLERKLFDPEFPLTPEQWERIAAHATRPTYLSDRETRALNALDLFTRTDNEGRSVLITRIAEIETSLEEVARLLREDRNEARGKIDELYERHIEQSARLAASLTEVTAVLRKANQVLDRQHWDEE